MGWHPSLDRQRVFAPIMVPRLETHHQQVRHPARRMADRPRRASDERLLYTEVAERRYRACRKVLPRLDGGADPGPGWWLCKAPTSKHIGLWNA
jgi:hypothetical protein